jgi:hypothetical protein
LWQSAAIRQALAAYERDPLTKSVRDEQSRTELIPARLRARAARALSEIGDDIDTILEGRGRPRRAIRVKRPWGMRGRVIEQVRAWCRKRYHLTVTARRVQASWAAYRVFKRTAAT